MAAKKKQVGGDHYSKRKVQPWDIIDEYAMGYYEGNILKYLLRWKDKDGVKDLQKAQHYLEKLIEVELAQQKNILKWLADAKPSEDMFEAWEWDEPKPAAGLPSESLFRKRQSYLMGNPDVDAS